MIDFMVLGLPRSGTAWLANLLTTDDSICLHESLMEFPISVLDFMPHCGLLGISETAGLFVDEIRLHPCKKLIVERPLDEINDSLRSLGLPEFNVEYKHLFQEAVGYRMQFADLFKYKHMKDAYKYLLNKELSKSRHDLLCRMDVQNRKAIADVKGMF
jgi:hypothetical protein